MRANTTKVSKPPPPVPPRPSKHVVAEALAKSRKPEASSDPLTVVPPVVKTQSYSAINKYNHSVPKFHQGVRAGDARPTPTTRTLIYQSSNTRPAQEPKESAKRKCAPVVTRTSSFQQVRSGVLEERDSSLESLGDSEPISRSNSFKTEANHSSDSVISDDEGNWQHDTNDRNHVNTLIDEMFASVLEVSDRSEPVLEAGVADRVTIHSDPSPDASKTIVVIKPNEPTAKPPSPDSNLTRAESPKDNEQDLQRRIADKFNHEQLISELSSMKRERLLSKRQRNPSETSSPSSESSKIQHSDWVEVNDGKEIRLSSCQITIDDEETKHLHLISRLAMSNLIGLPPLPKSLSGFNMADGAPPPPSTARRNPKTTPVSTNGDIGGSLKKSNNLDAKLALLRREMYSLRQLDLSLLSQLWSLNESIQDFRHMLQDQDDRSVLSPPSPSPTTSSGEEVDVDDYFHASPMRYRLAPPPPPPHRRTSNSSSGTGSSG